MYNFHKNPFILIKIAILLAMAVNVENNHLSQLLRTILRV